MCHLVFGNKQICTIKLAVGLSTRWFKLTISLSLYVLVISKYSKKQEAKNEVYIFYTCVYVNINVRSKERSSSSPLYHCSQGKVKDKCKNKPVWKKVEKFPVAANFNRHIFMNLQCIRLQQKLVKLSKLSIQWQQFL